MAYYNTFLMNRPLTEKAKREIELLRRIVFIRCKDSYYIGFCQEGHYTAVRISDETLLNDLKSFKFQNKKFFLGRGFSKQLMLKTRRYIQQQNGTLPYLCVGSGGYNTVFLMQQIPSEWSNKYKDWHGGKLVFKVKRKGSEGEHINDDINEKMCDTGRLLRVSKAVNGERFPIMSYKDGILLPFISGRSPTDDEYVNIILDVFKKSGRVFTDPFNKNVFINNKGKAIIIDFDLILDLSHSIISQKFFKSYGKFCKMYKKYYDKNEEPYPKAVALIKNLVYLIASVKRENILFFAQEYRTNVSATLLKAITPYRENGEKIPVEMMQKLLYGSKALEAFVKPNYFLNRKKRDNKKLLASSNTFPFQEKEKRSQNSDLFEAKKQDMKEVTYPSLVPE